MTGDNVSSIDEARRKKEGQLSKQDIEEFKAKLNREMTPRMKRWAEVLDLIEKGYWPQDPQFEMIDTPIEVSSRS
jgi:hypothetical protein